MAKKNRNSLKNAFRQGSQPTDEAFGDLIDSSLNTLDDGFDKTDQEGLKITQLGTSSKLMSFYQNVAVRDPQWSMKLGDENQQIIIENENTEPALSISKGDESHKNRVGINTNSPQHELDVGGVVASHGRIGANTGTVKADGEWHSIAGPFDGCQAFEVMAGVGEKQTGRYALLHAIAMNTFNRHATIDSRQSHYGPRCDQLKLRWTGSTHSYQLEIRTRCAYDDHTVIQYHLTALWFDPFMQKCDTRNNETT